MDVLKYYFNLFLRSKYILYSRKLHYFEYRIQFKINTLTYACIKGMAPQYLSDLLEIRTPGRDLTSTAEVTLANKMDQKKLKIPIERLTVTAVMGNVKTGVASTILDIFLQYCTV